MRTSPLNGRSRKDWGPIFYKPLRIGGSFIGEEDIYTASKYFSELISLLKREYRCFYDGEI